MQAKTTKVTEFFSGKKQYVIPIHQRKYSWDKNDECARLFEDLEEVGKKDLVHNNLNNEDEPVPHYLGSIVHKDITISGQSQLRLQIEDGQQRITSLSLLVLAMVSKMQEHPKACAIQDVCVDDLLEDYIINPRRPNDSYYKLILNDSDKKDFKELIKLVESGEKITRTMINQHKSSKIFKNYYYFKSKLNKHNIRTIYEGLLRLQIIEIFLDPFDVDQEIYESLNSTGKALSVVDQARNYLLMGLDPKSQEDLYTHYWRDMEILFEQYNPKEFDRFLRYYCILNLKKNVRVTNTYHDFKKITRNFQDSKNYIIDLCKYADYHMNIHYNKEKDPELHQLFEDLKNVNPMEYSPLLLKLYATYDAGRISKYEFIETVKVLENYLVRRAICGLSGNQGSDGLVVRLVKQIDIDNCEYSLKELLLSISGNLFFVDDDTLRRFIMNKNFCRFSRNKFVFTKLVYYDEGSLVNLMDQDFIYIHEDKNLDEIYTTKLGNLTFENIDFCMDIDAKNNEEFIDKRTSKLIDLFCKVWEYPVL